MLRQSRANKWLGRVDSAAHILETGIKIAGHLKTAYGVGRTIATAAAPLVAMAL